MDKAALATFGHTGPLDHLAIHVCLMHCLDIGKERDRIAPVGKGEVDGDYSSLPGPRPL